MPGKDIEKLFSRNTKAFKKHQPDLWFRLEAIKETVSTRIDEEGRAVNIDLGEITLYPEPADTWTAKQIETYFEFPDRIGFADPAHCNLSAVSMVALKNITRHFNEAGIDALANYPVVDVGYAFVFGIGLGLHIPQLIERTIAKHLILIEPVAEFILHSMYRVDWAEIFKAAKKKGITVHFVCTSDPHQNVTEIESLVRRHGGTFIDGSYAYVHYDSWHIQQARIILNEKIKLFYLSGGFFEDEILMMRNTYGNLKKWPFHLIERKPYINQDYPVFIIGSGPSLDASLPYIKKYRNRAFVFSCGTSLGIMLKNGIKPDFHVENENTSPLVNNIKEWKDEFGLQGIALIASSTVVPELSALFDKRWYFYRAALSSSSVLNGDSTPIDGADPMVSNAAFAVMTTLGFKNIYLFGVDCGRLHDGEHHSRDAIYYQDDYDNYVEGESLEFIEDSFTREVPGNFGGTVMTTGALDLSRRTITYVQQIRRANLVNCSNGALIELAKPMAAPALKLDNMPDRQGAIIAHLEDQMRDFRPGEFLETMDIERCVKGCDLFEQRFTEAMETARKKDKGFWDLEQRVQQFWDDNWDDCGAVLKIIGGTYASMVRLGAFGGTRIVGDKERLKYFRFYVGQYLETCLWMAAETRKMLAEMAAGKDDLSAVGVTESQDEDTMAGE